jgi:hypothetical protein
MTVKTYQQQQLESTPERTLPFLRAIAINQLIRYAMSGAGYTDADQAEGWQLLLAATGYASQKQSSNADSAARQAITELDDWDESGFRRIHAALNRLHPEQDAFVFSGLEASRGSAAVIGVTKLLDRLDQLEKGSNADKAAIDTLKKRGITADTRQHLRGLVAVAQAATLAESAVMPQPSDAQQKSLEALAAWHNDWSETARAIIRRRDHLILMGLAKRRNRKGEEAVEEPALNSTTVTHSETEAVQ